MQQGHVVSAFLICFVNVDLTPDFFHLSQTGFQATQIAPIIFAQETAILQMLLEAVSPKSSRDLKARDLKAFDSVAEIRAQVLNHVHQTFVNDPRGLIAKILHFQTYHRDLLPHVVDSVASMHTCLTFVEELSGLSDPARSVFGLHLGARLCDKYPMESTYV